MRVAVVKNASKYFCKSPRFSAERFAKNFAAACRIGARQLRRASAIVFPQTPIFSAGGVRIGVWYYALQLFYSPWACFLWYYQAGINTWGNTLHTLQHNTLYLHASH